MRELSRVFEAVFGCSFEVANLIFAKSSL